MMRKQVISAILIAAALTISACGSSSSGGSGSGSGSTSTQASSESTGKKSEADDSSFSQTVVDNDDVKFEITGIEHDNIWGYTWDVTLENKTDANVVFSMENVSVNGVMSDPFWAETVTAGNKSNTQISWSSSDFKENDIEKVTEVSFELRAYDDDNYDTEYLDETYTVYPYGEENAQNDSKEASDSDIVLFDNDQCSMRVTGVDPDDTWGYALKVTLVNKTDKDLMFSADDVSIDGVMCDPFWATTVAAGKTSNEDITWMDSTLSDAGITDTGSIKSIDLPMKVYPDDDYTGNYYVDETYTVNVENLK